MHSHPISKDTDTTELGKRHRETMPNNQPNPKRVASPMYNPTNQIYNYSTTTELSPIRIATTNSALINGQNHINHSNNNNTNNINNISKSNYLIPVLSQQYSSQNSQDNSNNM